MRARAGVQMRSCLHESIYTYDSENANIISMKSDNNSGADDNDDDVHHNNLLPQGHCYS